MKDFTESAEEHWKYVEAVLDHHIDLDEINFDTVMGWIEFHYISALIHGYKHGYDDCIEEFR